MRRAALGGILGMAQVVTMGCYHGGAVNGDTSPVARKRPAAAPVSAATPMSEPAPATVTALPPAPAAVAPLAITLTAHPKDCSSAAEAVTIDVKEGGARDVLDLLELVSGLEIESERDLGKVTISGTVGNLAWDCILRDIADQLGLRIDKRDDKLVLVEPAVR